MATILIVDDRAMNRNSLTALLGNLGHRLFEAADGTEGLRITKIERPDLIITDILMPTMDGYEFVRQLRSDPAIAHTAVIFCTAHYHEREAISLACACGVSSVLTNPAEPEEVLRAVNAALGCNPSSESLSPPAEFDREHLRLLTDKLSQSACELRRSNGRLSALVDLGLQLGSEMDLRRLLQTVAHAARNIVGARYAVVGIVEGDEQRSRYLFTSGMDAETAARLGSPDPRAAPLKTVLDSRRSSRVQNPGGDPAAIGLAPRFPPVHSWLGAPVMSPTRIFGWLGLIDKIGGHAFCDEDERLSSIIAAQVGRIYQNGSLYADVLHHASDLEREIGERKRVEQALAERASMALLVADVGVALTHGQTQQAALGLCTQALVRHLDAAFARIWTLNDLEQVLELQASSGMYTNLDGRHSRVPIGQFKIGLIAEERRPHLTNCVVGDPRVSDQEWAKREGMVAFAGYPLLVDDRLVGVMALFSRKPLSDATLEAMGAIADHISIGIVRKRVEESRDGLLKRLQLQIERMPLAYVLFDACLRVIDWNSAAERIFGYTKAEILNIDFREILVPPSAKEQTDEIIRRIKCGDMTAHWVNENVTKDGRIIICEWFNTPLVSDDGGFGGILSLAQEVTERKRLEDQFSKTQQRLQHVVESSPAVLFTLAIDLSLTWISGNVREMMGYQDEEVTTKNWWRERVHPEDLPGALAEIRQDLFGHDRLAQEYHFRHKDGKYRWVRSEMRLLRDTAGEPIEVIGSWADITERKLLEDQYRQAQKMEAVGRLAAGAAHDFNNILMVINGYCEMLLEGLRKGDPMQGDLEQIKKAGDRAVLLSRQLLAFSRKQVLQLSVLDLNTLLAEMETMLVRLIGEDIALAIHPAPAPALVKADAGQLEQIVMNLAINARDAMHTGGKLTIELAHVVLNETYAHVHPEASAGDYIQLSVIDTGCGMDDTTKLRLFEPFFSTKGEKGTGLGLSTVYGIVKQFGGQIEVHSELGIGTTLKLYLPRDYEGAPAPKSDPGLRIARRGNETVLLAEDEEGVRALVRLILEQNGYKVLEARHGEEALRICEQHKSVIQLLVTDVIMPNLSGRQVAEQLRSLRPQMKVLYMSGYTDDAVVRHGGLEADTAFLQKPFTASNLIRKVREVLDSKREFRVNGVSSVRSRL